MAGLGNPGVQYRNTRHNAGFKVVGLWARSLGVRLSGRRFRSMNAETRFQGRPMILLCPLTYMNLSGESIRACVEFYHIRRENILIVHDDIDLPVGRIRLVRGGGAGGHKGVLSVMHHLRTGDFPRLKIGVGRPRHGEDSVENHVLSPFYPDEREIMERVYYVAVQGCELFLVEGIDCAMNQINDQNLAE